MLDYLKKLDKLKYMYYLKLKYYGFSVKTSLLSVLKWQREE